MEYNDLKSEEDFEFADTAGRFQPINPNLRGSSSQN